MTKIIIGLGLIIAGILLGVYVGVWWALIGGIVKVITQVSAPHVDALQIAYGVVRIIFSGFLGWVSAVALIIPGFVTLSTVK